MKDRSPDPQSNQQPSSGEANLVPPAGKSSRVQQRYQGSGATASAPVQRSAAASAEPAAAPSSGDSKSGLGSIRAEMEHSFGADFGDVSLHRDGQAEAMGAQAFARGSDIHVASGKGDPGTVAGRSLIGHELAHVVQQRAGKVQAPQGKDAPIVEDPALERAADVAGAAAAQGQPVPAASRASLAKGSAPSSSAPMQMFYASEHKEIGDTASGGATTELAPGYSVGFGEMVGMSGDWFGSIGLMRRLARTPGSSAGTRGEIEFVRHKKFKKGSKSFDGSAKKAALSRYYTLAGKNTQHFLNPKAGDEKLSTKQKAQRTKRKMKLSGGYVYSGVDTRDAAHVQTGADLDDFGDGAPGSELAGSDNMDEPGSVGVDETIFGVDGEPDVSWVTVPIGAVATYRLNHVKALMEAAQAGRNNQPIASAMATEAFAAHFLTDTFCGGHARTPRMDAKQYWDNKVPQFFYNLKGYMAERIAKTLKKYHSGKVATTENTGNTGGLVGAGLGFVVLGPVGAGIGFFVGRNRKIKIKYGHLTTQIVWEKSRDKVSKALAKLGRIDFGDVVSGALHDLDNKRGVEAMVGDRRLTLKGEGQTADEKDAALAATLASLTELGIAHFLGRSMDPKAVAKSMMTDGLYAAEQLIPRVIPDDQQINKNPHVKWDYKTPEELLGAGDFKEAMKVFGLKQAGEINSITGSFDDAQKDALARGVVKPLKKDAASAVLGAINWSPNTGGGIGGHDTDDNALEYTKDIRAIKGGFKALTVKARVRLIKHLFAGWHIAESEEEGVWDILSSASDDDAQKVIDEVGWVKLYLNLDGAERRKFKRRFPADEYSQNRTVTIGRALSKVGADTGKTH